MINVVHSVAFVYLHAHPLSYIRPCSNSYAVSDIVGASTVIRSHPRNLVHTKTDLCPLAAPQTHGLAVLLQFGDELITLLHYVLVLLVLVVGAVRLDDALASDAIDGAGNAAAGDELCKVAGVSY